MRRVRQIREPVFLRDNGLTSFIPPCFKWELRGGAGDLLVVVSDLDLSSIDGASPRELEDEQSLLEGYIEEYETEQGAAGLRFVATTCSTRE